MNWDDKTQTLICDKACWQLGTDEINRQLKDWFDGQVRVWSAEELAVWDTDRTGWHNTETHQAILIGVRPIEKLTAESVLRELVGSFARPPDTVFRAQYIQLIEKAKRILNKE